MGWHHMNGWNWMWMVTMFVVFLGVVATLVTMSLRRSSTGAEPRSATTEDTLREQLARGEIDIDEFQRRLATMRA
jgi:putative membrane protein